MIEIVNAGLQSTVQGAPYRSSRHLGMPLSGAADSLAMALANYLAGNSPEKASIEFSMTGGGVKALTPVTIGLNGPIQQALHNGHSVDYYKSIRLNTNDILHIKPSPYGNHIYLSIQGGFKSDQYWDGNSTFLPAKMGGFAGRSLHNGDQLICNAENTDQFLKHEIPSRYHRQYSNNHIMRICISKEKNADTLLHQKWTVGRRGNRIGYELINMRDNNVFADMQNIKSSAVFTGTIQCPPSGNPFLLGPDAQTTGGYPNIAQVIRADRHCIGQIRSGDKIEFIPIHPSEAREVYRKKLSLWRKLIPALKLD